VRSMRNYARKKKRKNAVNYLCVFIVQEAMNRKSKLNINLLPREKSGNGEVKMETAKTTETAKGNVKIIKKIEMDKYKAQIAYYCRDGKEEYLVWNNETDEVEWSSVLDIIEDPFANSVSYDRWTKNKKTLRDAEEKYGVNFDTCQCYELPLCR